VLNGWPATAAVSELPQLAVMVASLVAMNQVSMPPVSLSTLPAAYAEMLQSGQVPARPGLPGLVPPVDANDGVMVTMVGVETAEVYLNVSTEMAGADRELVCAPLNSPEGQDYLAAMKGAANFAFCNRQLLTHLIRRSFDETLRGKVANAAVYQVYDIAHNMAKIEEHEVDGRRMSVCVHRKGATRAFGPGSPVLPAVYRDIGQPVLVPGSMGTASWVLVGTEGSMAQSFGSTCHGAGRMMSRSRAKREVQGGELRRELESRGIRVRAGSLAGLAEEAPEAYKDVDRVIEVVHGAGIARKVARLVPVAVVKG